MKKTRKNNPEHKRIKILNSARNLFIEQGYHTTSMSQIAKESGVTQSMIHYYFKSKKKLFEVVIADSIEPLYRQRIIPRDGERNITESLRGSLVQRFRFFQKNPQVVKLLVRTMLMEEFQPDELGKKMWGRWIETYRQKQKDGLIRSSISPENIMVIYLALSTYWFLDNMTRKTLGNRGGSTQEKADNDYLESVLSIFVEILQIQSPEGEKDK
jgi:TetR/AcrR family transcriptional regulator